VSSEAGIETFAVDANRVGINKGPYTLISEPERRRAGDTPLSVWQDTTTVEVAGLTRARHSTLDCSFDVVAVRDLGQAMAISTALSDSDLPGLLNEPDAKGFSRQLSRTTDVHRREREISNARVHRDIGHFGIERSLSAAQRPLRTTCTAQSDEWRRQIVHLFDRTRAPGRRPLRGKPASFGFGPPVPSCSAKRRCRRVTSSLASPPTRKSSSTAAVLA